MELKSSYICTCVCYMISVVNKGMELCKKVDLGGYSSGGGGWDLQFICIFDDLFFTVV